MEERDDSTPRVAENEASKNESEGACGGIPTKERPTCVIVLGMAGSGKTTFVQVKIALVFFQSQMTIFPDSNNFGYNLSETVVLKFRNF